MFFFRRKKLNEIEAKIDGLSQMLEQCMHDIRDNEKNNQQMLCELIVEKAEALANENKCRIEETETQLRNIETKIAALAEQNTDEFKNLAKVQKANDKSQIELFKDIKKSMEEGRIREQEIDEKLDLTENEIRMLLINSVMDQLD